MPSNKRESRHGASEFVAPAPRMHNRNGDDELAPRMQNLSIQRRGESRHAPQLGQQDSVHRRARSSRNSGVQIPATQNGGYGYLSQDGSGQVTGAAFASGSARRRLENGSHGGSFGATDVAYAHHAVLAARTQARRERKQELMRVRTGLWHGGQYLEQWSSEGAAFDSRRSSSSTSFRRAEDVLSDMLRSCPEVDRPDEFMQDVDNSIKGGMSGDKKSLR